jgi:hypothetical protein
MYTHALKKLLLPKGAPFLKKIGKWLAQGHVNMICEMRRFAMKTPSLPILNILDDEGFRW